VLGCSRGGSGDPSPITARGVWLGIKAAVAHKLGQDRLAGVRVAVQGLGHVGSHLAALLSKDGAELLVADIDADRAQTAAREFGARMVASDEILRAEVDVLAPCALGGVINDDTLPELACAIVAGAANNQLLENRHGKALHARGILYAPDYVINAGGLINIAEELQPGGHDPDRALTKVGAIATTLAEIFARSDEQGIPAHEIADRIAAERIRIGRLARQSRECAPDRTALRAIALS
jgi:leucine dehydrogenase